MSFRYLTETIKDARFRHDPFRHLFVSEFFRPEHFQEIVRAPEVALPVCSSDQELIERLTATGYEPIPFPGTTSNIEEYLEWHKTKSGLNGNQVTCEGIGIVFRLKKRVSGILQDLDAYMTSPEFLQTMADKFGLDLDSVRTDLGLQKYLDGYEISPHPDVRQKALTWMINVNPAAESEQLDYHTHYLKFMPERRYVLEYWRYNHDADRCWVPWGWCRTVKRQTENNSAVAFSPSHDTMHAVVARYDHLRTQRTQLYGNFWSKAVMPRSKPFFQDFEITATSRLLNTDPANRSLVSAPVAPGASAR